MPMCRTANWEALWFGSIFQLWVSAPHAATKPGTNSQANFLIANFSFIELEANARTPQSARHQRELCDRSSSHFRRQAAMRLLSHNPEAESVVLLRCAEHRTQPVCCAVPLCFHFLKI